MISNACPTCASGGAAPVPGTSAFVAAETPGLRTVTTTIENILARDGMLTYRIRGVSMEPMLRQDRDLVTIRAARPGERFAVNDVVLYLRAGDRKHTLHRIVGVGEGTYTILGDNCMNYERGIPFADVLGVLVSFVRDGRPCTVQDADYLAYVRRLRRWERPRIAWRRSKLRVKAALKRAFPGLARRLKERRARGAE